MMKIVATPSQALANIHRFEEELPSASGLQDRLAYARSWYADQGKSGKWSFGPSKFIGYENIDAATYLQEAQESDGRRTEAQLQMWFSVVDPKTPLHGELSSALFALLAKYGKTPSTKMRISVRRERLGRLFQITSTDDSRDLVVDMMVAVARTLPTAQFQNLRAQLADLAGD